MKKWLHALVTGASVVAAVTLPANSASAAGDDSVLRNAKSSACLRDPGPRYKLASGSCGSDAVWHRIPVSNNRYMLQNVSTGRCMDTNGTDLYMSSCSSADSGQRWISFDSFHSWQAANGKVLVQWDTYVVGLSAIDDIDDSRKYSWTNTFSM
ncbi:hypothetical protein [Streptomyces sp. NBC_00568]|uniref:hypothetical protein n=1 Tax=Streptomyces sp. NBC_00568 TaxID=2975779 RepID=UPI002252EA23|nr:hypothetical protein [Streptomyces sp. NBC_00568]MCX4993615.1 RICIN domain-containing protein [Streptomyces sp. NBC_00568]